MKKFSLIAIFLIATTVIADQEIHYENVGTIIFNALYIPAWGESIRKTIDFGKDGNLFCGFFTGLAGLSLSSLGIRHLILETKIFLELWKKYENKESIKIEWRKLPRKAIMAFLALLGSVYGFTIAYAGFDRMRSHRYRPSGESLY